MNMEIDQSTEELSIRLNKLEDTLNNLYAQVQSMDSEIFLLQSELTDIKILLKADE